MSKTPLNDAQKIDLLSKQIGKYYQLEVRGSERFITDKVRRALVYDAMHTVMLEMYESQENGKVTISPNLYVDAAARVMKSLSL